LQLWELEGTAFDGAGVKQTVEILPDSEVRFRYEVTPPNGRTKTGAIPWPLHLWEPAVSFVGVEGGRRVKGRLMDLARPLRFEDTVQLDLSRGSSRLRGKAGPQKRV